MLARTFLRFAVGAMVLAADVAMAAPTLEAPATAKVGSEVTFTVSGPGNPRDFVRVMPGSYTVRLKGQKSTPKPATIEQQETTTVAF
jgi:hypothetical protein